MEVALEVAQTTRAHASAQPGARGRAHRRAAVKMPDQLAVRSGAGDGLELCVAVCASTSKYAAAFAPRCTPRRELLKMQPVLLAPIADGHEGALSHVRHFPWTRCRSRACAGLVLVELEKLGSCRRDFDVGPQLAHKRPLSVTNVGADERVTPEHGRSPKLRAF